ncbi:MAG: caspase family protein [Leptolyngbya sp. RL_3_1]|nr:caspase family protein [Leptolyngbya sp. RL_3_1]
MGVGRYGEGLKSLQCPANGVTALQTVLETPEIGGFDEVIPLVDPDVGTMRSRMGEVFNRLTKHDLVLFYFTGHGIKDMAGAFYLTTAQTQLFGDGRLNPGTAIEASFVKSLIGNCYAQRKVVVLDCCFGAAFADGFLTMDDGGVDVQADLGGEGYVVLTAATARNYALEQEGEPLSVYTRYLVEGLKTGGGGTGGKGLCVGEASA